MRLPFSEVTGSRTYSRGAARTTQIIIGGGRGIRWLVLWAYGSEVTDTHFQPPPPLAGEEGALVTEVHQTIFNLEDLALCLPLDSSGLPTIGDVDPERVHYRVFHRRRSDT